MAADSSSSQAAQARRLKQVVDQAAAHFGRCFGQPRKPARTQSLFLPTDPEPYSALELPDASAEVDPLQSTLTNQWRDLEEARETRHRSANRRRRMADRRRVKNEVVIPSVFPEPRHFGTTFRMSAQCGSVKLALEDDMLHRELRRKVQLNNQADRCHSVSPFPDRKPRGLYARTVDLSQSQLVDRVLNSCGEVEAVSRKPRLQLKPLKHKPPQPLVEPQPLPRKPAVPRRPPMLSRRVTGKCYLGLEDDMEDDYGVSSWFMNGTV